MEQSLAYIYLSVRNRKVQRTMECEYAIVRFTIKIITWSQTVMDSDSYNIKNKLLQMHIILDNF